MLLSLVVVGLLTIQSASMVSVSMTKLRAFERAATLLQAFYAAEGGISRAIAQLRGDASWSGTQLQQIAKEDRYYNVTVLPRRTNPPWSFDDPSSWRRVRSIGYAPFRGRWQPYQVDAILKVKRDVVTFTTSLFGRTEIEIAGNATLDSYDSRVGPYGTGPIGSDADIGTNSTAAGAVSLGGNADLNGDIYIGPGGNPNTVVTSGGNAQVSGGVVVNASPVTLPPVTVPSTLTNSGTFNLDGQRTQTLAAGMYWFDSFRVAGQSTLNTDGDVTIYVTGDVDINQAVVEAHNFDPTSLRIYVVGQEEVTIAARSTYYGVVYAPESEIAIEGGSEVFGAAVGDDISFKGSNQSTRLHFDLALLDQIYQIGDATVEQLLWKPAGPLPPQLAAGP